MLAKLCSVCLEFFRNFPLMPGESRDAKYTAKAKDEKVSNLYSTSYYSSLLSWKQSADHGCDLCVRFWAKFAEEAEIQGKDETELTSLLKTTTPSAILSTTKVVRGNHRYKWITLSFKDDLFCLKEDGNFYFSLQIHHSDLVVPQFPEVGIEVSTGSSSAIALIKQWLKHCHREHSECSSDIQSSSEFPTRLLCVSYNQLNLVAVEELPSKPLYLTLSHCWGTIELLKLSRSNLLAFQIRIPEAPLCQTFKDAIDLTRSLGYDYIWIDSLCIIQDDEDDWRQEASKMSSVYGGSELNLAAAAAKDGRAGCFVNRSKDFIQQIKRIEISRPDTSTSKLLSLLDSDAYDKYVQSCPLNTRGWTFQERFLAPRTVHFTKLQIYWECRTTIACETFQGCLPRLALMETMDRYDLNTIWSTVITHYSGRKLTYEKDRLVAISGVAKWINKRRGDNYIAGMWEKDLESQLLWDGRDTYKHTTSSDILPSWSWTSYNFPISSTYSESSRNDPDKIRLSEVINSKIVLRGNDPYGEIISGNLSLRIPPLITIETFEKTYDAGCANVLRSINTPLSLIFDLKEHPHNLVFCLGLFSSPSDNENDDLAQIQGLLVVETPVCGHFRRVGLFYSTSGFESFVNRLRKNPENWEDELVYESKAGVDNFGYPRYNITLV